MSLQDLQPYPQSKIICSSSSIFRAFPATGPNHQKALTTTQNDAFFSSSTARTRHFRPPRRRVTFKPTVTVRSIPHFNRYPAAMKKKIWNSTAEIDSNARRNKIEFQAEGWNWRNVVMEDQMLVDVDMGELVHPCHVSSNNRSTTTQQHQGAANGNHRQRTSVFPTRQVQGELILC